MIIKKVNRTIYLQFSINPDGSMAPMYLTYIGWPAFAVMPWQFHLYFRH